jgi:hypothetical protein
MGMRMSTIGYSLREAGRTLRKEATQQTPVMFAAAVGIHAVLKHCFDVPLDICRPVVVAAAGVGEAVVAVIIVRAEGAVADHSPGTPADDEVGEQPREVDGQQALRLRHVALVRSGQRDGHSRQRNLHVEVENEVRLIDAALQTA